jgi:hypothetical protein
VARDCARGKTCGICTSFEGGYWLLLWDFLLASAIAIFLLTSRLSTRLRDLAERITRFKALQAGFYAIAYVLMVYLLSFPLLVYSGFVREHRYGLANQSFGPWFGEQLIGFLSLDAIVSALAMTALYAVFRRAPRTWWLWGSGLGFLFLVLQMMVAPVFIAPLFNTYNVISGPKDQPPNPGHGERKSNPGQPSFRSGRVPPEYAGKRECLGHVRHHPQFAE